MKRNLGGLAGRCMADGWREGKAGQEATLQRVITCRWAAVHVRRPAMVASAAARRCPGRREGDQSIVASLTERGH